MTAVQRVRPEVIDDFVESVPTVRANPWQPSAEFTAWCQRWNLLPVTSAVFGWAIRTRIAWKKSPELKDRREWPTKVWAASKNNGALSIEYPNSLMLRARSPNGPLEAFPELEDKAEFMGRAERHWEARVAALQGEMQPTPTVPARYFDWLARYLVPPTDGQRTENFAQIAKRDGRKQKAVSRGVYAAATLLGLSPPPVRRGRPARARP